jgi:hypothetical protein
MLPPGRLRLATKPNWTGSTPRVKTIGIAPPAGGFVARWCAGSRVDTPGGVFQVREDEPMPQVGAGCIARRDFLPPWNITPAGPGAREEKSAVMAGARAPLPQGRPECALCAEALEKALSHYGRPEIFTRDPLLRRSQGARVKGAHLECAPGRTTYSPSL